MSGAGLVLGVWSLVAAAGPGSGGLSGVYVDAKNTFERIEFSPDGKFYACNPDREGTYSQQGDQFVCKIADQRESRFHRKGRLLVDQDGREWTPREDLLKMPWKDVRPVTLVVLDRETKKPIPKFTYTFRISSPTGTYDGLLARRPEVQSETGSFELLAPESCSIELQIDGDTILGGFGRWWAYHLTAENKQRRIEVLVSTGTAIKGVVVEAGSGKPIAGAAVSPMIFTPPSFSPDRERTVKTDARGRFLIRGVDASLGIHVWHADYLEFNRNGFQQAGKPIGDKLYEARIELSTGERMTGVVKDPAGKPLAGVEVSDGAGKTVRSGEDGSFVLASPQKWSGDETYNLTFEKAGYLEADLRPKAADPKGFSIVLHPQPKLHGQVLGPDGRPVAAFEVSAGPGPEPAPWACTTEKVRSAEGRFSLPVRTDRDYGNSGKVWVGVKSPGFAVWEDTLAVWQGDKSITARLKPGVSVSGRIEGPYANTGEITAEILPRLLHHEMYSSSDSSQRQDLLRRTSAVNAQGVFRFADVNPGPYALTIWGPRIAPLETGISVAGADADADAGGFSPRGRGSVQGIVYQATQICEGGVCRLDEKRGVWAFADGTISMAYASGNHATGQPKYLAPLSFKTDEKGRFHVDGVPAGTVQLCFNYLITADIVGSHVRYAQVTEGKTTEVRFFDVSDQWNVTCKFVVGDGSPAQFASGSGMAASRKVENVTTRAPMFEVRLRPLGDMQSYPATDWEELDAKKQILLRDVQPGKYRVDVGDWMMSRGFHGTLYQTELDHKPGASVVTIPLGAGCITGEVRWPKKFRYMVMVVAVGKKAHAVREARCDGAGNFSLRYLPDDEYQIFAHDYDAGWCKLPAVTVKSNVTDVGVHTLAAGGTITGSLPPRWGLDPGVTVAATDSRGVTVEHPNWFEPIGATFSISNLWPDRWTLTLRKGDQVLAGKSVVVQGTETVVAALVE